MLLLFYFIFFNSMVGDEGFDIWMFTLKTRGGVVRIQNMTVGLYSYLGSQSICIVGFGFSTTGGPMLGNLDTLLFRQTLLFTSESLPFFLKMVVLFSPSSP